MENDTPGYDAIVIGSGIGALTCAAILSKFNNKKILILERHYVAGGFTHEFMRKGKYKWDVGLHYVGEMQENSTARNIMNYITDNQLEWNKMPDIFEKFIYPDFIFNVHSDPEAYTDDLIAVFPNEKASILQYFKDVKSATSWFQKHFLSTFFPAYVKIPLSILLKLTSSNALATTQEYLNLHFKDNKLKALLASQWGDYGIPPSESAFATHANIVTHYLNGAYYPEGGAEQIANNVKKVIEKAGGKIMLSREVTQILVRNNTAVGVKAIVKLGEPKEEEYLAPMIISDAGAYSTYLRLIPNEVKIKFKEEVQSFPKGRSAITLYLAFKESPEKLGFKGENCWIFSGYDHGKSSSHANTRLSEGKVDICFLSFPSLKNPKSNTHVAEAITFCNYNLFEKWKDQRWHRREKEYYELKEKISDGLIALIEQHYPGFTDLVEYNELSTPLTIEHFSNRQSGEMYGIPAIPKRYRINWCSVNTPINSLYLTGSDACALGIVGAMWGGVATASVINGPLGFFKLMYKIGKDGKKPSSARSQSPHL